MPEDDKTLCPLGGLAMQQQSKIIILVIVAAAILSGNSGLAAEQKIVRLATINWEPYTGENLPGHGFFSELVTESFARVGYRVQFYYLPWARALEETKKGLFDGLMNAYWKKDRVEFLHYPDVVWKVREEFIALKDNPISFDGTLASLKGYEIGVLRKSAQAEEIEAAGVKTWALSDQVRNVKKLLAGRIDAMIIPRAIFFYHLERVAPQFDPAQIKILEPSYKIYDMYVVFSKQKPNYAQLTNNFNRGLSLIKADRIYQKILHKHHVRYEE